MKALVHHGRCGVGLMNIDAPKPGAGVQPWSPVCA